jgi:hypothetical protein
MKLKSPEKMRTQSSHNCVSQSCSSRLVKEEEDAAKSHHFPESVADRSEERWRLRKKRRQEGIDRHISRGTTGSGTRGRSERREIEL